MDFGLLLGFKKRMMVEDPVGALSNLLAVTKSDVRAQPGLLAAQRLICTCTMMMSDCVPRPFNLKVNELPSTC